MRNKSLSLFIILCLLITGLSTTSVFAATNSDIQKSVIEVLYNGKGGKVLCDYGKKGKDYDGSSGNIHEGIDFKASNGKGTKVYAIADGEVVAARKSNGLTTLAIYNSEKNITVVYLHSDYKVSVGKKVSRGDYIATEGDNGNGGKLSNPHTHISLRNGRKEYAAVSKDTTLENPDPYPLLEKLGYPNVGVPSAPTGLQGIATSTTSIKLTWKKSTDATSYKITRRMAGDNDYVTIKNGYSTTSYTDTGLQPQKRYYYRVYAVNSSGTSEKTQIGVHTKIEKPTVKYDASSSNTQITLTWKKPQNGSKYVVQRSENGGAYKSVKTISNGDTKSYTDTGLTIGSKYKYMIYCTSSVDGNTYNFYSEVSPETLIKAKNHIELWATGFKNEEGNNNNKDCYLLGDTVFIKNKGDEYALSVSQNKSVVPNGFSLNTTKWGSRGYTSDGSWKWYTFSDKVTQLAKNTWVQYQCNPVQYKITYNLNGGTNNKDNPTTYNILYGVTLKNPTKAGYTFAGWKDSTGKVVPGINSGKNAKFSSAQNMIDQLKLRTTGDQTLTANWTANKVTFSFDANGGSGSMSNVSCSVGQDIALPQNGFTRTGYSFSGWNVKRLADEKWYVAGQGWVTESEINSKGFNKKLYSESTSYTVDSSWTSGYNGTSNYAFYSVWEKSDVPAPTPTTDRVLKLSVENVKHNLKAGDTVKLKINADQNTGFVYGGVTVGWDKSALELTNVEYDDNKAPAYNSADIENTGEYVISFGNTDSKTVFDQTGTFFTLSFRITDKAAEKTYPITLQTHDGGIFLTEEEEVSLSATNGSITLAKSAFLIGDVNNDGKVNRADSLILNRYLANWNGYADKIVSWDAADVNQDGKVNRADSLILNRYLANWTGYEKYFQ